MCFTVISFKYFLHMSLTTVFFRRWHPGPTTGFPGFRVRPRFSHFSSAAGLRKGVLKSIPRSPTHGSGRVHPSENARRKHVLGEETKKVVRRSLFNSEEVFVPLDIFRLEEFFGEKKRQRRFMKVSKAPNLFQLSCQGMWQSTATSVSTATRLSILPAGSRSVSIHRSVRRTTTGSRPKVCVLGQ